MRDEKLRLVSLIVRLDYQPLFGKGARAPGRVDQTWKNGGNRAYLVVGKSLEYFCKQTRIGIIPTWKANPNIFLIALKQDYIGAQYVKLAYSMWPFTIFYALLRKWGQNDQKRNNFKGVYVTRRDADQISWPFFKRDFDMLRILNLPIRA